MTGKRVAAAIGITLGILFFVSPLLWLANVYSEAYPNSLNVQIELPSTNTYYENSGGRESHCPYVYWGLDADLDIGRRKEIREYYSKIWNQEPIPGGLLVNTDPEIWAMWDYYTLFSWSGQNHSLFVYKEVGYPGYPESELGETHFRYDVTTKIIFCSVVN